LRRSGDGAAEAASGSASDNDGRTESAEGDAS
jgi:hypothetical protein